MISFQPDGIRPVYCDDCFKKLKNGEIQPIKPQRNRPIKSQSSYESDLAMVGIEFSPEPPRPPRQTQPFRQAQVDHTQSERDQDRPNQTYPRSDQKPQTFTSLKNLKN
jgi:hypothetical protein